MRKMIFMLAVLEVLLFGCDMTTDDFVSDEPTSAIADDQYMSEVDTARNVDYLSAVEKDIVLEMNKARTKPALYAELYIEPRLKNFNGNIYNGSLLTKEGAVAVNECVSAMKRASAVKALKTAKGLSLAAQQHSSTQSKTDQIGHTGVDGSSPFDRIKQYGTYRAAGENIAYGTKSGQEIVIQLLIDDGVSSRGHRENIMSKDFDTTGVGYANEHQRYGSMCVITYAGGYKEK